MIDNIIPFPGVNRPRSADLGANIDISISSIIDLQSCRTAAKEKARTAAANRPAPPLTSDEVWAALNDDRLVMHYQPQYDLRSGKMLAAEALIRFIDLDGNLIYPDRFIDIMEYGDLVVPLGRTVIENVCADLAACRGKGFAIERMAINLSARQLNIDPTLLSFIDQVLTYYGLDYSDLEFELTERQRLTPQCEGLAVLEELANRGTRVVIDDFGIGYSSVVYLAELPVSAWKLDRAMVSRLPEDTAMQSLVEGVLALAQNLDIEVIAEGIEARAQSDYLVKVGCPYAQGFAYAKPMSADDLRTFMAEGVRDSMQTRLKF